jgi:hypothetical protein
MNEFSYSGIPNEYLTPIGNARPIRPIERGRAKTDYDDLPNLRSMIKRLIEQTDKIMSDATTKLTEYNLSVRPQTRLYEAQTQLTPGVPTPDHVSFNEYAVLGSQKHRAANYVKSEYEYTMRGPSGTNAMDVYLIASIVNEEARNIDSFLNQYLGDVNDSSERRTVELFQEWALASFKHTGALRFFLAEREKLRNKISNNELAQVDSETARQYQAVFQAKLNVVNNQFEKELNAFTKEYTYLSRVFYDKVLGPALYFRTRVMQHIEPRTQSEIKKSILGREVMTAQASLNANMAGGLTDHLRRNRTYTERIDNLFKLMQIRTGYKTYIEQLAVKGSKVANEFKSASEVVPVKPDVFGVPKITQNYRSEHNLLDGTEDDDAHTQYILRNGGSVLSDLYVKEGVKIAGIDLPKHGHTGEDGTEKLTGDSFEEGTLYSELVDTTNRGIQPSELGVDQQVIRRRQGAVQVETTLKWKQNPEEKFEIQIVPANAAHNEPSADLSGWNTFMTFIDFTTEDSNFLSFVGAEAGTFDIKVYTRDVNGDMISYDAGYIDPYPALNYVPPITLGVLQGATSGRRVQEVGSMLYYIEMGVGIRATPLMSETNQIIHANDSEAYGDVVRRVQSVNLNYDPERRRLFWFDMHWTVEDGEPVEYWSELMSYDIATAETTQVRTYPTKVAGNGIQEDFLFYPSASSVVYGDYLYVQCLNIDYDTGTEDLIWLTSEDEEPYPAITLIRFDLDTGDFVKTSYADTQSICTFFVWKENLYMSMLFEDPSVLEYEEDYEYEVGRGVIQIASDDEDGNLTYRWIPLESTEPNEGNAIIVAGADQYDNLYALLPVGNIDERLLSIFSQLKEAEDD